MKNLSEFKKAASSKEYNTLNAWGFGGRYGRSYTLNSFEYLDVKRSYRHTGSIKEPSFYVNEKEVEESVFLEAIKNI